MSHNNIIVLSFMWQLLKSTPRIAYSKMPLPANILCPAEALEYWIIEKIYQKKN